MHAATPSFSRLLPARVTTVVLRPEGVVVHDRSGADTVAVGAGDGQDSQTPLREAVKALTAILARRAARRERITLLVSDHWLRALVIPMSGTALTDTETAILVDRAFEHAFGATPNAWVSRWLPQPDGSVLAAAWPSALAQIAVDTALQLRYAAPLSLEVFGAAPWGRQSAWAMLVDGAVVSVARVERRSWRCWRVARFDEWEAAVVLDWFHRIVAQTADACRDVWIGAYGAPEMVAQPFHDGLRSAGWTVHAIRGLP